MLFIACTLVHGISAHCDASQLPLLESKCLPFIKKDGLKVPPSQDCCATLKNMDIPCICSKFIKGPIENITSVEKALDVVKTCGLSAPSPRTKFGSNQKGKVVVSRDGRGNFKTITEAIKSAPNNSLDVYFVIFIRAGIYEEYVTVPENKKYLKLIGAGINRTIITGHRNKVDSFGVDRSATFAILGEGFVAINITFRNTAGPIKQQAVAVRNDADKSAFYRCSFEGYQDTLYARQQRQFYRECDIYGTIDFIFGDAVAVFQNCNIYLRRPSRGQFNVITAQGRTDPTKSSGTFIQNSVIKAASDLAPVVRTVKSYLGRPWKDYSTTVYLQCYIDSLIDPRGWHEWNGSDFLNTLYFAEYNNKGPGSKTRGRVRWANYHVINSIDAAKFTVSRLLLGKGNWLPKTGIPFKGGLV